MAALFYHMTRSVPEGLAPTLVERALAAGWRVELRGADPARIEAMDAGLWLREGFLPHGRAGGAHDARQPVLLTLRGEAAGNGAACLIALDGVEVGVDEAARLERVCVLFDGGDEAAVARARGQWTALTAAGVAAEYWSEADGRWERKR